MRNTFPLSYVLLALLLLAAPAARASDTLKVAPRYYHIDKSKRIILVNQALAGLNADPAQLKSHIVLDRPYAFSQPLRQLRSDSSYQLRTDSLRYTLYFTQLPVVRISSRLPIVDSPSVYAQFSLTEPGGQQTTANMGIEIRGAFSQSYPKKSYELSFWNDTTGASSRDVRLLAMRSDNKYNLQALYNEPLRFRSKVSNELWQEMHQLYYKAQEPDAKNGIAMEYAEVFVNSEYKGIYCLSERVDRKQLKLKKYSTATGIAGELYKGSDWGATTFTALPPFDNASATWGGFEYKHPEEQIDWSRLYSFVDFVENSTDQAFFSTYRQRFSLANAVDYFILLNLTRATDNTGKNIYIAKYKQGEPYYYVPWDLDGVFGTDWQGLEANTTDDVLTNGFYDRLLQDCSPGGFRATLRARWAALRTTVVTENHIMTKFRANYNQLAASNLYAREQLTWSGFRADTAQLTYLNTWLRNRLQFLDATFGQACAPLAAAESTVRPTGLQLYPNPATDYVTLDTDGAAELTIRDLSGRLLLQTMLPARASRVDVRHLPKGLCLATVRRGQQQRTQKLLLR